MKPRHTTSGMSLIEMSVTITISGVLLGSSVGVLTHLQRLAQVDTSRGTRAEWACDQLRGDVEAGGVHRIAEGLQVQRGDHLCRWRLHEGHLERNGRQMLAVARFDITTTNQQMIVITITPVGLPPRRIETHL